jgi:cytochrome c oxidase subunit I
LRATDHKPIGLMHSFTSFLYFSAGGFMALLMRAELGRPGLQFLFPEQYDQLLTMHGSIMLLLFATPLVFGFANLVLPCRSAHWTSASRGSTASRTGSACSAR